VQAVGHPVGSHVPETQVWFDAQVMPAHEPTQFFEEKSEVGLHA
jgi:hypothetical protein